jgi:hypothetical protein
MLRDCRLRKRQLIDNDAARRRLFARQHPEDSHPDRMGGSFGERREFGVRGFALERPVDRDRPIRRSLRAAPCDRLVVGIRRLSSIVDGRATCVPSVCAGEKPKTRRRGANLAGSSAERCRRNQ